MKTIEYFVAELNAKFPKDEPFKYNFMFTTGKRFYKICRSRDGVTPNSSYAFVDKNDGNLYKSASWSTPALHVRGNINDDSGLNACNEYSVMYLISNHVSYK